MIRVRVELVPFGNEENSREIAQMVIANDGTGNSDLGNYGFARSDTFDHEEGAVFTFDRKRSVWELIGKCLDSKDRHLDQDFLDRISDKLIS